MALEIKSSNSSNQLLSFSSFRFVRSPSKHLLRIKELQQTFFCRDEKERQKGIRPSKAKPAPSSLTLALLQLRRGVVCRCLSPSSLSAL